MGEPRLNAIVARPYASILYMSVAVGVYSNRPYQCGNNQVADLQAGMIVAVSKSGDFYNSIIRVLAGAEFAREHRMGDIIVESVGTIVSYHTTITVDFLKVLLEISTKCLN